MLTGYIGTYNAKESKGIYSFELDESKGSMSLPHLYFEAPDAKYLAQKDGILAAPVKRGKKAGICVLDTKGKDGVSGAEILTEEVTSCYITFHEDRIYTANFHEGTVSIYGFKGIRPWMEKRIVIAPGAGCHQVLFMGGQMLVPCMELDEIHVFEGDGEYTKTDILSFPKGSGPRHAVSDRKEEWLYAAGQKDNRIYGFRRDEKGKFREEWTLSLLEKRGGRNEETAAIRLSADERFLYLSVRGEDAIYVISLEDAEPVIVQRSSCGGKHPRDIVLAAGGDFLIAANRNTRDLVSFSLNRETGFIEKECGRIKTGEAVSILFG